MLSLIKYSINYQGVVTWYFIYNTLDSKMLDLCGNGNASDISITNNNFFTIN